MHTAGILVFRSVFYMILAVMDFLFLIGSYSVLRTLHISVHWVTWTIGTVLIVASTFLCFAVLLPLPPMLTRYAMYGNLIGVFSFLIAVYAASQWTTRQWYIRVKKQAASSLIQGSKHMLLFLRKHHQFFGWLIAMTAVAHMVYYLPNVGDFRQFTIVTGFIAIGILALSVLLGVWMWLQTRLKRRMPRYVHNVHAALTVAFFVVLFVHM